MKTNKPNIQRVATFAGFADWFEIFRAGEQTDSQGRKRNFTEADLDSMVANHDAANSAPLVIGHPKTDDPAFGWVEQLKREGKKLFAKAIPTVPEFEDAVKNKLYPNRSVAIVPAGDGWKLRHIGFLGAVAPAIAGMERLKFSADDDVFEFAVEDDIGPIKGVLHGIKNLLRRMRDQSIEQIGLEKTDDLFPSWELDSIEHGIDRIGQNPARDPLYAQEGDNADVSFTSDEELEMEKAELEAQLKAEREENARIKREYEAKEKTALFNAALTAAQTQVATLLADGKLLPAQSTGLAEFMARLDTSDDAQFEFAAGEGKTGKETPAKFFNEFLAKLGKQIKFGKQDDAAPDADDDANFDAPAGTVVNSDRLALHNKALKYQAEHKCDYVFAVQAVEAAGK